tara:strand:+ start:162 stop:974 length:813 start_codon:yes stop_codon:yes gene_type:complete
MNITKNLTIIGESIAAEHTSFYIPELKILLDCGIKCKSKVEYIFITHSHWDHTKALPDIILEADNKPVIYIVNYIFDTISNFLSSVVKLNSCNNTLSYSSYCILNQLNNKDNINIKFNKSNNYNIVTYNCDHDVPTIGYGFIEIRNKIKDEYKDLDKSKIIDLKKSNVEITKQVYYPRFVFLGDTTINILYNTDILSVGYETIIIECTLLYTSDKLGRKMHIHWDQLKSIIIKNSDIKFILIHFSAKYKKEEIITFFKKEDVINAIPYFI